MVDLRECVIALSVVCRPAQTLDTIQLAFKVSGRALLQAAAITAMGGALSPVGQHPSSQWLVAHFRKPLPLAGALLWTPFPKDQPHTVCVPPRHGPVLLSPKAGRDQVPRWHLQPPGSTVRGTLVLYVATRWHWRPTGDCD